MAAISRRTRRVFGTCTQPQVRLPHDAFALHPALTLLLLFFHFLGGCFAGSVELYLSSVSLSGSDTLNIYSGLTTSGSPLYTITSSSGYPATTISQNTYLTLELSIDYYGSSAWFQASVSQTSSNDDDYPNDHTVDIFVVAMAAYNLQIEKCGAAVGAWLVAILVNLFAWALVTFKFRATTKRSLRLHPRGCTCLCCVCVFLGDFLW